MLHVAMDKLKGKLAIKPQYENFIGGKWVAPISGQYFDNITPITGQVVCKVPRSNASDIEAALDAAHAAREKWGRTSPAERARILNKMADAMEANLDLLALVETVDNGKPIRETTHADVPLAIDHFRDFAGAIRAQEGSAGELLARGLEGGGRARGHVGGPIEPAHVAVLAAQRHEQGVIAEPMGTGSEVAGFVRSALTAPAVAGGSQEDLAAGGHFVPGDAALLREAGGGEVAVIEEAVVAKELGRDEQRVSGERGPRGVRRMPRPGRCERQHLPEALTGTREEVDEVGGRGPKVPDAEGAGEGGGVEQHAGFAPFGMVSQGSASCLQSVAHHFLLVERRDAAPLSFPSREALDSAPAAASAPERRARARSRRSAPRRVMSLLNRLSRPLALRSW